MSTAQNDIEIKLAAARTRLILEKPFLGALVMHLTLKPVKWCKTTGTDARAFYYNPEFIDGLNLSQTQFMLAHEALHCALGHFARRHHRTKRRWDVACDHAVNHLLAGEGLKAPPGALMNPVYKHLTAEEIYPFILAEPTEEPLDDHLYDGEGDEEQGLGEGDNALSQVGSNRGQEKEGKGSSSGEEKNEGKGGTTADGHQEQQGKTGGSEEHEALEGKPKPLDSSPTAKEELASQWKQRLASAAQQARQAGKLGESWMRVVDELIQPKLPWRMLLARYMVSVARDDYSFQRPSRREGAAMMPSLLSGQVELVVVLDTSGSIGDAEIAEFVSEVDALKGQIKARVTLHACDERLNAKGPWIFQSWEPLILPDEINGGAGTDFRPIFDWVETDTPRPDLLLYFTDAEGEFPKYEPPYPVIWLVKGKAKIPWGQRIQLN
ncbi:vWA domain-containing protein [Sulfurirhabdus autotrophica]|uniref:Putative metal-dependent peptidase n=1 Tax=Sulfurirhabdus autotrophica TaxID=1706046 RepID=A0A4R3YEE7_9PROT|nr:VWA-like domain-containing protein [Sulfurirhabdus autotrophica]TCV90440.1 putative metal-dependent peptidase [Sulfurirhabdus autotrophica]